MHRFCAEFVRLGQLVVAQVDDGSFHLVGSLREMISWLCAFGQIFRRLGNVARVSARFALDRH